VVRASQIHFSLGMSGRQPIPPPLAVPYSSLADYRAWLEQRQEAPDENASQPDERYDTDEDDELPKDGDLRRPDFTRSPVRHVRYATSSRRFAFDIILPIRVQFLYRV
jgi:hypothetical protein